MSVDTRIREALRTEDRAWEASAAASYDAVVAGARRRVVVRRTTIGSLVAVAALLGGIVFAPHQDSGPEPARPTPSPNLGDDRSDTSSPPYGQEPLDGRWQTRPLTRADIEATLREAGLNRFGEDYAATFPRGSFRIRLTSFAGNLVVRVRAGGHDQAVDREFLHPEGRTLTVRPGSPGHGRTTYRYAVTDDRLTLAFLTTTAPGYDGFPAEVQKRALFTTAPFTRS